MKKMTEESDKFVTKSKKRATKWKKHTQIDRIE